MAQGFYDSVYNYVQREYFETSLYGLNSYDGCYIGNKFRYLLEYWEIWYAGYDEEFHNQYRYNGIENVSHRVKQLKMAKKVCEDKSSLSFSEKFNINLDNKLSNELLNKILEQNNFSVKYKELVERTFALGTGATIVFLNNNKINIDYISARNIIPITVINGEIRDCSFVSTTQVGDDIVFYLNTHIRLFPAETEEQKTSRIEYGLDPSFDGYLVENRVLKQRGNELIDTSFDDGEVLDYVAYNTPNPMFHIIKPNIANNVCLDEVQNGMGISVFANAIDNLMAVDNAFDNLDNEVVTGRKRIMVHDSQADIRTITNQNGDVVQNALFDSNDSVFFAMDMGDEVTVPVKEIDMSLRIEPLTKAMDRQLQLLSMRVGLGNNYYKFDGSGLKTATEVVSDNAPLYRQQKLDEKILTNSIMKLTRSILYLLDLNEEQSINVNFDDGIIEDETAIMNKALLEFSSGLTDKVDYFMRTRNMTEKQAIDFVEGMQDRKIEEPTAVIDFIATE